MKKNDSKFLIDKLFSEFKYIVILIIVAVIVITIIAFAIGALIF